MSWKTTGSQTLCPNTGNQAPQGGQEPDGAWGAAHGMGWMLLKPGDSSALTRCREQQPWAQSLQRAARTDPPGSGLWLWGTKITHGFHKILSKWSSSGCALAGGSRRNTWTPRTRIQCPAFSWCKASKINESSEI